MSDDFPCCKPLEPQRLWAIPEPEPATDYARITVLQTERAYLDRELVRAGNHSRTAATDMCARRDAIDAVIRKELSID